MYNGSGSPQLSDSVQIAERVPDLLILASKGGVIWANRGNTLLRSENEGSTWKELGSIEYPMLSIYNFAKYKLMRKLFGKERGILAIKILETGTILVHGVHGSHIWRSEDGGKSFKKVHQINTSFMAQGWTLKNNTVYVGEYSLNQNRERVNIWKGVNDGKDWSIVYSFPKNSIKHIHSVQFDKFDNKIWVTTGDENDESRILYSTDEGKTFKAIGEGSQQWRAVSLMFDENNVYWGTDSPNIQNYVYKWDRANEETTEIQKIDGPVYYSTELNNGDLVFATTVEYGKGEWDDAAHVWVKNKGEKLWESIGKWKRLPRTNEFGIIKFAHPNESEYIFLSPLRTIDHYNLLKVKLVK